MNDVFDSLMWAYRGVFVQTAVGGGIIVVNVQANERTVILYGQVNISDTAADRNLRIDVADDVGGNLISSVVYTTPLDNETFPISVPSMKTAGTPFTTVDFNQAIILGVGDVLKLTLSTPAQDETLTLHLRALHKSYAPTVTTTGSGGTVTMTPTYDEAR